MPTFNNLTTYLNARLTTARYPASEWGVYVPGDQPIHRLGLCLDPFPELGTWVVQHQIDALWLHRPWQVAPGMLPPDVPVLFHHLPFDEQLTTGMNKPLANALGMTNLEEIGYKQVADAAGMLLPKRPIGMIGDVPEHTYDDWLSLIRTEFGGYERAERGLARTYGRVAVVGAMNPALIQEAHERGVELYLTGEYRNGTQPMVDQTGMTVIAIGHRRTEEWGLRALAGIFWNKWAELDVVI